MSEKSFFESLNTIHDIATRHRQVDQLEKQTALLAHLVETKEPSAEDKAILADMRRREKEYNDKFAAYGWEPRSLEEADILRGMNHLGKDHQWYWDQLVRIAKEVKVDPYAYTLRTRSGDVITTPGLFSKMLIDLRREITQAKYRLGKITYEEYENELKKYPKQRPESDISIRLRNLIDGFGKPNPDRFKDEQ